MRPQNTNVVSTIAAMLLETSKEKYKALSNTGRNVITGSAMVLVNYRVEVVPVSSGLCFVGYRNKNQIIYRSRTVLTTNS
jgi:hypothetical protein